MKTTLKTISHKNLITRIEKHSIPKTGGGKIIRKWAALFAHQNEIMCAWNTGSGRYTQVTDHSEYVRGALLQMGISCEVRNSAPRGGRHGNYVFIKTKVTGFTKPEAKPPMSAPKPSAPPVPKVDAPEIILEWFAMGDKMHPAPAKITEMKAASGLSWRRFVYQFV